MNTTPCTISLQRSMLISWAGKKNLPLLSSSHVHKCVCVCGERVCMWALRERFCACVCARCRSHCSWAGPKRLKQGEEGKKIFPTNVDCVVVVDAVAARRCCCCTTGLLWVCCCRRSWKFNPAESWNSNPLKGSKRSTQQKMFWTELSTQLRRRRHTQMF